MTTHVHKMLNIVLGLKRTLILMTSDLLSTVKAISKANQTNTVTR